MRKLIGKPQILKEVNSSMIEQLVYERGPLTKPDLAKITSLSLPTVSKLVDALENSSRLCRAGHSGKGAGRKAVLYETNKNSGCIIVLYYLLGKYRCRIADMLNNSLYEAAFPLDGSSSRNAASSTLNAIDSLMNRAPTKVKAVGVGMPGVVKSGGLLLGIPQIGVWEGFNLEELLYRRYKTKICVENNVKISAVGYYHTRLKDKQDNIVYIYVGNGIGAGLIINKQLYRGASNFSGEIGFMTSLADKTPFRDYTLQGGFMETHLGKFVDYAQGDFRKKGDPRQRDGFVDILSMIAADYVAILNPEVIVFSGAIFDDTLIESINRRTARYIPREIMPLILRDDSDDSGIEGLVLTCRSCITTGTQLVRRQGRIRRQVV